MKNIFMVARWKGCWGVTAKGYGVSFWGDNVLELNSSDSCTTL